LVLELQIKVLLVVLKVAHQLDREAVVLVQQVLQKMAQLMRERLGVLVWPQQLMLHPLLVLVAEVVVVTRALAALAALAAVVLVVTMLLALLEQLILEEAAVVVEVVLLLLLAQAAQVS
jgi:hypothetical protein